LRKSPALAGLFHCLFFRFLPLAEISGLANLIQKVFGLKV
jgi:hypothetical protein